MMLENRDYQNRVVDKTLNYFKSGSSSVLSPTGKDKRVEFSYASWRDNHDGQTIRKANGNCEIKYQRPEEPVVEMSVLLWEDG